MPIINAMLAKYPAKYPNKAFFVSLESTGLVLASSSEVKKEKKELGFEKVP